MTSVNLNTQRNNNNNNNNTTTNTEPSSTIHNAIAGASQPPESDLEAKKTVNFLDLSVLPLATAKKVIKVVNLLPHLTPMNIGRNTHAIIKGIQDAKASLSRQSRES